MEGVSDEIVGSLETEFSVFVPAREIFVIDYALS